MAEKNGIYKCKVCGNVVTVIEEHEGTLVCCGQEMNRIAEKTGEEEGKEKHVPLIEKSEHGIVVKIGSTPHPMEENHYISLVQLMKDGKVITGKRLGPEDEPKAEFCCISYSDDLKVRIYCNVHGAWTN